MGPCFSGEPVLEIERIPPNLVGFTRVLAVQGNIILPSDKIGNLVPSLQSLDKMSVLVKQTPQ